MLSNDEVELSFLLTGIRDVLPSSYYKLRSYLNIHLSNLAEQKNLNLPKSLRNRNKTCPYCYSDWSSDTSSFKLLPSKKSKLRQNQNGKEKGGNEEGQTKESRNTLILKCKVCTNKSVFSLVKKQPPSKIVKKETVKSVKKKKKKKDKSCGLLITLNDDDTSVTEISDKEKRSKKGIQRENPKSVFKHPLNNFTHSTSKDKSNSIGRKNKQLVPNPLALQCQKISSKKKNKKLQNLKKIIKNNKGINMAKKTLKDFLTLI